MADFYDQYGDYELFGFRTEDGRDLDEYIVLVETTDKEVLFREITQITRTAATTGIEIFSAAINNIGDYTISKAKTRADFDLYEKGEDYIQEINSSSNEVTIEPLDDDNIQNRLLIGLRNVRKKYPSNYKHHTINVQGFCYLNGIDIKQYLYNASILVEDGLIGEQATKDNGIESGNIFITSMGTKVISERMQSTSKRNLPTSPKLKFDVAISYAGEQREIAERLANLLEERGLEVFYDQEKQHELWGENLPDILEVVYTDAARYCIILISKEYKDKMYPNLERKFALARAIREGGAYILPIQIDGTKISGIPETLGYLSMKKYSLEEIVDFFIRKVESGK